MTSTEELCVDFVKEGMRDSGKGGEVDRQGHFLFGSGSGSPAQSLTSI